MPYPTTLRLTPSHMALLTVVFAIGRPMQAQQDTRSVRIALSPIEIPEVRGDSARAFQTRLVTALSAFTDSTSLVTPEVFPQRLKDAGVADAWSRFLFTFVTSGIVDPGDLVSVCGGLGVQRILHVELGDVVEGAETSPRGEPLQVMRVGLRLWTLDCRTAQLAGERWAEGFHRFELPGAWLTSRARSTSTAGAVSAAIDVLIDGLRPYG